MNWSGRRVETKLLAFNFCRTKYGACGSFLGKLWSPCASKVRDLKIAALETAGDFTVQVAAQFQRILISCVCSYVNYGYSCEMPMQRRQCVRLFWNDNTGKC
jgi:hypothetical protein